MNNIETKVDRFIQENNMLKGVSVVYVATSGGADSMALLYFLDAHKNKYGIKVSAVHVNHGIRGASARRDAEHVRSFCSDRDIEYILFDAEEDGVEVPDNASEEWARDLRYGYFKTLLTEDGHKIATAHTLSDQAETMLFRLARGTGLKGMCGIPIIRDNYIRPTMCITRQEIEELCSLYGIQFITDETNLGDAYARNKIRHKVIPVLKSISECPEISIGKTCDRMSKAMQFMENTANRALNEAVVIPEHSFDVQKIIREDSALYEYIAMQLLASAQELKESNIEKLVSWLNTVRTMYETQETSEETSEETVVGAMDLNNEVRLVVTNKYITVDKGLSVSEQCNKEGVFGISGYKFKIEEITMEQFKAECNEKRELAYYADASRLDLDKLKARGKREQDRFKPAQRMEKRLKRFISELHVPLMDRDMIPVVTESDSDNIIWVWGLGFTDGFTPTSETKRVLRVKQI